MLCYRILLRYRVAASGRLPLSSLLSHHTAMNRRHFKSVTPASPSTLLPLSLFHLSLVSPRVTAGRRLLLSPLQTCCWCDPLKDVTAVNLPTLLYLRCLKVFPAAPPEASQSCRRVKIVTSLTASKLPPRFKTDNDIQFIYGHSIDKTALFTFFKTQNPTLFSTTRHSWASMDTFTPLRSDGQEILANFGGQRRVHRMGKLLEERKSRSLHRWWWGEDNLHSFT